MKLLHICNNLDLYAYGKKFIGADVSCYICILFVSFYSHAFTVPIIEGGSNVRLTDDGESDLLVVCSFYSRWGDVGISI